VQILSDDSYLAYYEETKDEAQQRIWTFYEAIKFGYEINLVLSASVDLRMPLLPTVPLNLRNSNALRADFAERFLDLIKLKWFYDGFHFLHLLLPPPYVALINIAKMSFV
jgi:hypothetical protein